RIVETFRERADGVAPVPGRRRRRPLDHEHVAAPLAAEDRDDLPRCRHARADTRVGPYARPCVLLRRRGRADTRPPHDRADPIGQRAHNGCASAAPNAVVTAVSWAPTRSRIFSAAAFAIGPVLPTGPTHPGQPLSHGHSAMSLRVAATSSSCI